MAMIREEFTVDDDRTYLMGHSMGGADTVVPPTNTRAWAESMEAIGMEGDYVEFPDGDHGTVINDGMPLIFELFEANTR